jgi:hypothetical protein
MLAPRATNCISPTVRSNSTARLRMIVSRDCAGRSTGAAPLGILRVQLALALCRRHLAASQGHRLKDALVAEGRFLIRPSYLTRWIRRFFRARCALFSHVAQFNPDCVSFTAQKPWPPWAQSEVPSLEK